MRSWPFWIVVVVVVSGPWFGVVRHPQWDHVTLVPFHGFEDKPKDIVANCLCSFPLAGRS